MTQIVFLGTTATTNVYGAGITTGAVQALPNWAPPIEYIGSTTPWLAMIENVTTDATAGYISAAGGKAYMLKVRSYGRKSQLHGGAEVIGLKDKINQAGSGKRIKITLTYQAVGELVRPS